MSGGSMDYVCWTLEDKIYTSFTWFARAHNSHLEVDYPLVLEQCTGVRDRKGTLIFEGDLVKTATGVIGEIVFYEDFARFIVKFENAHCYNVDTSLEIIGNVHKLENFEQ